MDDPLDIPKLRLCWMESLEGSGPVPACPHLFHSHLWIVQTRLLTKQAKKNECLFMPPPRVHLLTIRVSIGKYYVDKVA